MFSGCSGWSAEKTAHCLRPEPGWLRESAVLETTLSTASSVVYQFSPLYISDPVVRKLNTMYPKFSLAALSTEWVVTFSGGVLLMALLSMNENTADLGRRAIRETSSRTDMVDVCSCFKCAFILKSG
jgi:hypothetical protein